MPRSGWNRAARVALMAGSLWAIAAPGLARGAEWAMEPSFGVKGEYNDNVLFTFLDHDPVYGVWYSPASRFKYRSEVLEVDANAAADFVNYYGESGLDITNYYFPASARYRTEKDRFQFDGAYIRDNTLVGELQLTGVVNRRTQRNWWNAHPQWTHAVTDRLSLNAEYQFTKATYQNAFQFLLFDYTTNMGSAGIDYRIGERDVFNVTGYYLSFSAPFFDLESHYYGLQVGLTHLFTDTIRGVLSAGFRNIESTETQVGVSIKSTDFVWVANSSLEKRFERGEASLSYLREIYPSGVGFLIQTDHLSTLLKYEITPTLWATFGADAYWISSTVEGANIPNSRLLYLEPRLHYRWTEWWSVELSYRHGRVDVDQVDSTATQNAAYLQVTSNIPR